MARKQLIRSSEFPYHIYNRTLEHRFYDFPLDELWAEAAALLRVLSWAYDFKIHAFVLMGNHYHLLATTPSANLDAGIRYFQSELSRWIHIRTGQQRFRFGARYGWSLIGNVKYARDVFRYVLQNPRRAEIAASVELYRFSTLQTQLGISNTGIPIHPMNFCEGIPDLTDPDFLNWLNDIPVDEELKQIRSGLRHSKFKIAKRGGASAKGD
jgi:putative transposase